MIIGDARPDLAGPALCGAGLSSSPFHRLAAPLPYILAPKLHGVSPGLRCRQVVFPLTSADAHNA